MSKLSHENVGKKFVCTNEDANLMIVYKVIDESFDYPGFGGGTRYQYGYEVESVKQYDGKLDKWEELSDDLYQKMEKEIDRLIEKDI